MNRIYQPLYKSSSKKKYLCRFSNTMKEGFLYEHCAKKVFETMAHYFVNLCSTNQFLEMLWRRRQQQQQKKVCLIIMEASHAVLRQMMLSLELWLLSCWLYLYNRWIRSPPFLARSTVICNQEIDSTTIFEMILWFFCIKDNFLYQIEAHLLPKFKFKSVDVTQIFWQ